jgi:hypothetical protein
VNVCPQEEKGLMASLGFNDFYLAGHVMLRMNNQSYSVGVKAIIGEGSG